MRKIIITIFIISFTLVLFFSIRQLNKPTDIDYLETIATKAKEYTSKHKKLYYFSNSKKRGLMFKAQLAFIPKQIIKKNIDDISESEIMLVIIDKKVEPTTLQINKNFMFSDTLFYDENNYYKLILLKK